MKTLTLAQIEEIKGLNKQILMHEKEAEEVRAFHPCTIQHWFNDYECKIWYQHSTMVLQSEPFEIGITYDSYRKKWNIFSHFTKMFKNVTNGTVTYTQSKIEEPKNIGKLSTKKINDWKAYLTEVYNALAITNESNSNEIDLFLKSIEGQDVQWYGESKKRGEILKNGIVFRFDIDATSVSTEIKLDFAIPRTLESFLKLSDNKY